MRPLVVICSEDAEFCLIFGHILEEAGFANELAMDGEQAVRLASEREPQAFVLDCQPAGAIGPAVCARLKSDPRCRAQPVIALIAPGAEYQLLELLKAGIDESFVRPFAPAKLLAHLQAKLAEALPRPKGFEGETLTYGDLEVRVASHKMRCTGRQLHVGPIEFNLLRHLVENRGSVSSRDDLIKAAWPANSRVDARTVDVHISRLRKALRPVSSGSTIRTVRSGGYALDERDQ
ncbi:response regulator transcription factor [Mesorhizobium sp. BH1-1-4]|uniref:response regulator transcription factor n=1 Tax=Mesorhizobium sp. BH1-1-4 TaxID=2876662 RepID=UPI001CD10164|nr:response regulator transcription factor [Mesorhizobium sp. BH1-1-4]MBZ9994055.1 response regulator transcription factor [Mesorhizobium sp. BH1-1-4]